MEDLATVDQAAKFFSVSKFTIYHWISDGILEYVKLGNAVRFEWTALQRHVRRCRRNGNGNGKSDEEKQ